MGEAEDVVAARDAERRSVMTQRYEACLPKIHRLVPLAVANLKKHNYPDSYRAMVNFQGKRRVAWELYHDGWGGNCKIDLLADGVLVKNDGSSMSDRVTFSVTDESSAEILEEVVSRLEYFATSDFQVPKVRGISPF